MRIALTTGYTPWGPSGYYRRANGPRLWSFGPGRFDRAPWSENLGFPVRRFPGCLQTPLYVHQAVGSPV